MCNMMTVVDNDCTVELKCDFPQKKKKARMFGDGPRRILSQGICVSNCLLVLFNK